MKCLKLAFFYSFILLSYLLNAQNTISVEYKEWSEQPGTISGGTPIYKLIIYPSYSVYFQSDFLKINLPYFKDEEPEDEYKKANDFLYKFYRGQKILFLSEKINKNYFVVFDSLQLMKWEIQKAKPVRYLGLDCYQAKGYFRGRNYTAYFAPKIKKSDGPFKFSGLPGLIIRIASDDQFIIWQAIKINYHEKEIRGITEKFKEKPISFQVYAKLTKWKDRCYIKEYRASHPPDPGETYDIEIPYTEKNLQLSFSENKFINQIITK
jgi:GLPGLI family protein